MTAFLPTLITSPADVYQLVFEAVRAAGAPPGAEPLGIHLEGPYLSQRRAGAHKLELIEAANDHLFESLLAPGDVRLMTLAPERPGASERIAASRKRCALGSLDIHLQKIDAVDPMPRGERLRAVERPGRHRHRAGAVDDREVLDEVLRDAARPDDAPADLCSHGPNVIRAGRLRSVAVLIDSPVWPWRGRLWSHLVSDVSYEELHAFVATELGIPRRAFQGDHYDIPQDLYDIAVAAGAQPVGARELLSRLLAAGLRVRKQRAPGGG